MKWFVEDGDQHYRIKMGPNLIKNHQKSFWKVNGDLIQLSVFCYWRFMNLNDAFRSNWQVNARLMHGNQMEHLLHVIPYKMDSGSGTFHFEPKNIHYKALRKAFFVVIEKEVVEQDGQSVNFESGDCTVTVHFNRNV